MNPSSSKGKKKQHQQVQQEAGTGLRAARSMRGSRARTNFVYSDMPAGSSVTSIISPDEQQSLQHQHQHQQQHGGNDNSLSSLLFNVVPSLHDHHQQDSTPIFNQDFSSQCHLVEGFSSTTCGGDFWSCSSNNNSCNQQLQHAIQNNVLSHDFPSDTFHGSGYNTGQCDWIDSSASGLMGFEDQTTMTNGLESVGCSSGSYFGFDSGDYVHSPLFSRMPPVSDTAPDGFDLGSSSYFF
ncbi:hypothetical protein OIU84_022782 [Salix udensis]|uniref:Uncharacterized protein n=1 Tax=Salix udensis TaxID=889485 RepID=A0AAD6KRT5_9ROSI|nr:hypothetical protein OIU84_022782 [Salix udensis]